MADHDACQPEPLAAVVDSGVPDGIVDAHVHLWDVDLLDYPWLDLVPALRRSFAPDDFRAHCGAVDVGQYVFVQADCTPEQGLAEASWVHGLAAADRRLAAIVAFAPLEQGDRVRGHLDALHELPLVRGIRRLLQGERDPEFCLQPAFVAGVRALAEFGFSCDLCIRHDQLREVTDLARRCPDVSFVLDHAGKPAIKDGVIEPWRTRLRELAALPNVQCKLSGLVTEADHEAWTREQLQPYFAAVADAFGFDRVMFGSDWPVATLACDYARWVDVAAWLLDGCSDGERRLVFGDTARRFYQLEGRGRLGGLIVG